jgi:hypothetical protein
MHGHVDSKLRSFKPKKISDDNTNISLPDVPKPDISTLNKIEMEKRMRDGFPRFRNIQPHEKKDEEHRKIVAKNKENSEGICLLI